MASRPCRSYPVTPLLYLPHPRVVRRYQPEEAGIPAHQHCTRARQQLVNTLLVPLPLLLAEFEFFNFAGGGFGKVAKLHGLGALEMRHVLTAEGDDVLG